MIELACFRHFHHSALENRSKQVESRGPPGMADYEIEYIDALIAKHGDDFIAMSRDIKRNFNQCTPTQLKRKVEKYQAFMNKAAN
jgi:nucleolar protein 16